MSVASLQSALSDIDAALLAPPPYPGGGTDPNAYYEGAMAQAILGGSTGTIDVTGDTTWAQFTADTRIDVNSGSPSSQDIVTHGASSAGIEIVIQNLGAGLVSINFDGTGNVAQLPQNAVAGFIWSGTQWNLLTPVSGSNVRGKWIKNPDHTLVQHGNSAGNNTNPETIVFPISFSDLINFQIVTTYNLNTSGVEVLNAVPDSSSITVSQASFRKSQIRASGTSIISSGIPTEVFSYIAMGNY